MILSKDTNPDNQIYRIGALVISILNQSKDTEIDSINLYNELNEKHEISISAYCFGLDWLYMVGAVEINKGRLSKCF